MLYKSYEERALFININWFNGLIFTQLFLFTGLRYSTASNASLIFSIASLITVLLASVILKEKITNN
ncbi:MAG: EamA family transporter [Niallia sp.]